MNRKNAGILLPTILFFMTVVSRLPFHSRALYVWDSVNYALALEKFDIASHQPHPPGYIVYVWLGKLMSFFLHDPNLAYTAISILSSALAVVFLYLLAKEMGGQRTGLVASVFLLSSPLFLLYGAVALPYAMEALVSVCVAYLCWRSKQRPGSQAFVSAVLLGIGAGIRPQLLFFLLPLFLYSLWRRKSWPTAILSLILLSLTVLTWLIPISGLSGGIRNYFGSSSSHLFNLLSISPSDIAKTSIKFAATTVFALGIGTVLLFVFFRPARQIWRKNHDVLTFLIAWTVWPAFFLAFVFIGHGGHILIILPALCVLLAIAGSASSKRTQSYKRPRAGDRGLSYLRLYGPMPTAGIIFVMAINLAIMTSFPIWWKSRGINTIFRSIYVQPLNRSSAAIEALNGYLEESSSADNPVLITFAEDIGSLSAYRLVMYYFPHYPVFQLNLETPEEGYLSSFERQDRKVFRTEIDLPEEIDTLIFFVAGKKKILAEKAHPVHSGDVWIYSIPVEQESRPIGPYTFHKIPHSLRQ